MFPPIEVETEIITSSYCNNNNNSGGGKELVFDSNQSSFSSSMRSLTQSPKSPKVVFITLSRRRSSVHNLVNTILGRPPDHHRHPSLNEFTDAASLDEIAQCMNSIGGGGGGSFKIKRFSGGGGISSGSFRFRLNNHDVDGVHCRSPTMANSGSRGVSPLLSPVVFMVEEVSNTEITINVSNIPYENDDDYYDYEDNINDCSGCDCDDDMIPLTTTSRMVYSENSEVNKKEAMGGGEDIIIVNGVDKREKGDDDNNNNNNDMNIVDNNDINDSYDNDDNVYGASNNNNNNNVYDNYDELHSSIDEDEHDDEEKEDEYFTSDSTSDKNDNSACGDISSPAILAQTF